MTWVKAGAVIVALALAAPGSAWADALTDAVRADLLHPASAVPLNNVTVGAPDADEAVVSPATNIRVILDSPAGTPLSSILVPPGAVPFFTTTTAKRLIWDLAALEAAKHAVADGAAIGTVTIVRSTNDADGRLIVAMPPGEAPPASSTAMSLSQVHTAIKNGLPPWASQATVTVVEDAEQERVVQVTAQIPRLALRAYAPGTILRGLVSQQQRLAPEGARIGRVVVEVTDTISGEPVYTGGADSFLGFSGEWHSPLIAGFVGSESPDPQVAADDAAAEVLAGP